VNLALSGSPATPGSATALHNYLPTSQDYEILTANLNAGDVVKATVNTQAYGGGLDSFLSVYDGGGQQIAYNDNYYGTDSSVTFQAATTGTYSFVVSASGNTAFDPTTGSGVVAGNTHGLFDFTLSRTPSSPAPDIEGESFQAPSTATWGDQITVNYTIANRGASIFAGTTLQLYLSTSPVIDGTAQAIAGEFISVPAIASGASTSGSLTFTLTNPGGSFPSSGPIYIGYLPPAGSIQHQRLTAAPIAVLQPDAVPGSATSIGSSLQVSVDPTVETDIEFTGSLTSGQSNYIQIQVPAGLSAGRLLADLQGQGIGTQLSLLDSNGNVLTQSDGQDGGADALIDQSLVTNTYYLKVEVSSPGGYVLRFRFVPSTSPFQPIPDTDPSLGSGQTNTPQGVLSADLNGDGIADLLVPGGVPDSSGQSHATIFLGNGDGTFRYGSTIPVPGDFFAVFVAGDFSGNGRLDLATADSADSEVWVYQNNGNGTFAAPVIYNVDSGAFTLVSADFNGDGILDLATLNTASVSVLLGDGHGGFGPAQTTAITTPIVTTALVAADFDHNGTEDLAFADQQGNQIGLMLGNGDGTFQAPVFISTLIPSTGFGVSPNFLAAADLNGDGLPDLAVLNEGNSDLEVLLNNAAAPGSFQAPFAYAAGLPGDALGLTTADFTGDGSVDIVVINYPNTLLFFNNNGDGTFADAVTGNLPGTFPIGVAAASFRGDGLVDVAVAENSSGDVAVLTPRANGTFALSAVAQVGAPDLGLDAVATADFNVDGNLDFVTANSNSGWISLFEGNGAGGFVDAGGFFAGGPGATNVAPQALAVGHFISGDTLPDLAVLDTNNSAVYIYQNNGDGTFTLVSTDTDVAFPWNMTAADFNGDGLTDLAVANFGDNTLSVLLSNGDGTFQATSYTVGTGPESVAVGDFNNDGLPDIAVADTQSSDVWVLLNQAASPGTFANGPDGGPIFLPPNLTSPTSLAVGDFSGNGNVDLAVAIKDEAEVVILDGDGAGSFSLDPTLNFSTGTAPAYLAAGRFGASQTLGLAVVDRYSYDVDLFLQTTDSGGNVTGYQLVSGSSLNGTVAVGAQPLALAIGNFTGSGLSDLVVANADSNDISFFTGNADGSLTAAGRFTAGQRPQALVGGDFNGDGLTDYVTANANDSGLSVDLGAGGGTLQKVATEVPVGLGADALAAADFNGDGRLDLAVANYSTGTVTLWFGNGDGTFQQGPTVLQDVFGLDGLVAGDFNGDHLPDLAAVNFATGTVSVMLNLGNGNFAAPVSYALGAGAGPEAIIAADLTGTGTLDLVTADALSNTVSVLRGNGDGTFQAAVNYAVGVGPAALVAADLNESNKKGLDLAVANAGGSSVSVLLNNGDGTFGPTTEFPVDGGDGGPLALVAVPNSQSGHQDLLVADSSSADGGPLVNGAAPTLTLLAGNGDGTFAAGQDYVTPARVNAVAGQELFTLAVGDSTASGLPEIAAGNYGIADPYILLSIGSSSNLTFYTANQIAPAAASTPLLADFTGDGAPDVVVRRADGEILFRQEISPGVYGSAVIVNPGASAVDAAIVSRNGKNEIAALGANGEITFYAYNTATGQFDVDGTTTVPNSLPTRIGAADLTSNGLSDLVVTDAANNLVYVLMQNPDGSFTTYKTSLPDVGSIVSIGFANLSNPSGPPDILLTDGFEGQAIVLQNDFATNPSDPFQQVAAYRAGTGPSSLGSGSIGSTSQTVQSQDDTVALIPWGPQNDLIALNQGTAAADLLVNSGSGSLTNPQGFVTLPTGANAVAAAAVTVGSQLDLVVLDQANNEALIYSAGPTGQYTLTSTAAVGSGSTGISVADLNGDGNQDLLVSNGFGDVLVLLGDGQGNFKSFQPTGTTALAVGDLAGNGQTEIVYANQDLNHVLVQVSGGSQTLQQGVLAPGAVKLITVGGVQYLVVANTGSNDVLLYQGDGTGNFTLTGTYSVGTAPTGLTIADLNGDGIPDVVVANKASNDLSILYGQTSSGYSLVNGPRLQAGGIAPVSTAVYIDPTTGNPNILVANSQSNTVTELKGVGGGFFNDQNPLVYLTGPNPIQVLTGNFDGQGLGFLAIDGGAGPNSNITLYSNFTTAETFGSGGSGADAGVAGDFFGSGLSDLLVVNGSGTISLLVGTVEGLVFEKLFSDPSLTHPSDIALAPDEKSFYVTEQGLDLARQFILDDNPLSAQGTSVNTGFATNLTGTSGSSVDLILIVTSLPPDSGNQNANPALTAEVLASLTALTLGGGGDGAEIASDGGAGEATIDGRKALKTVMQLVAEAETGFELVVDSSARLIAEGAKPFVVAAEVSGMGDEHGLASAEASILAAWRTFGREIRTHLKPVEMLVAPYLWGRASNPSPSESMEKLPTRSALPEPNTPLFPESGQGIPEAALLIGEQPGEDELGGSLASPLLAAFFALPVFRPQPKEDERHRTMWV
jgi:hypothetical protein